MKTARAPLGIRGLTWFLPCVLPSLRQTWLPRPHRRTPQPQVSLLLQGHSREHCNALSARSSRIVLNTMETMEDTE